jgi:hypothetical protein
MAARLQKDLREFIELLNSTKVKYVLVGGHAVAYHGFPRFTGDIDFYIESSASNLALVAKVLTDFGFASLAAQVSPASAAGMIFQLGRPPHRIDLVTAIDGVSFEEAWENREPALLDGLPVSILSKSLLIRNKRASGRPKDLEDARQLEDT